MADLDFRREFTTDDRYEQDRRVAEQDYFEDFDAWLDGLDAEAKKFATPDSGSDETISGALNAWRDRLDAEAKKPKTPDSGTDETFSAALRREPPPPLPKRSVSVEAILHLVTICSDFAKADLIAYAHYLYRAAVPQSRIVQEVERRAETVLSEARRRKWDKAIETISHLFDLEEWVSEQWTFVETDVRNHVHEIERAIWFRIPAGEQTERVPEEPRWLTAAVDEVSFDDLPPDVLREIKAQLLKAATACWESPDLSASLDCMRQAFHATAQALFDAGILTAERLADISSLVWNSAQAGGWFCILKEQHHEFSIERRSDGVWNHQYALFRTQIADWQAKCQGSPSQMEPTTLQEDSLARDRGGLETHPSNYPQSEAGESTLSAAQPKPPEVLELIREAMSLRSLNGPRLTKEIHALLRRKRVARRKADRATIFRIVRGETKTPDPALREALIEVLQLPAGKAEIVRHGLTRPQLQHKKSPKI